jgi:hypothetical protein
VPAYVTILSKPITGQLLGGTTTDIDPKRRCRSVSLGPPLELVSIKVQH